MRRSRAFLCACLSGLLGSATLVAGAPTAHAQDQTGGQGGGSMDFTASAPASAPSAGPSLNEIEGAQMPTGPKATQPAPAATNQQVINSDIQVIQRKAFLKSGRFELAPSFGFSINDPLLRSYAVGGEANYFLSDSFSVGLDLNVFIPQFQDAYYNVPLDERVLPAVNRYNFEGGIDFGYVPIYGKFAFLESGVLHWEGWISGGVGLTQTQIVPRDPSEPGWNNNNISPDVGVGVRIFLNHWLTLRVGVKDYMMLDTFEPSDRTRGEPLSQVESEAKQKYTQFVQNVVAFFGVSWYLPPYFEYTTNR